MLAYRKHSELSTSPSAQSDNLEIDNTDGATIDQPPFFLLQWYDGDEDDVVFGYSTLGLMVLNTGQKCDGNSTPQEIHKPCVLELLKHWGLVKVQRTSISAWLVLEEVTTKLVLVEAHQVDAAGLDHLVLVQRPLTKRSASPIDQPNLRTTVSPQWTTFCTRITSTLAATVMLGRNLWPQFDVVCFHRRSVLFDLMNRNDLGGIHVRLGVRGDHKFDGNSRIALTRRALRRVKPVVSCRRIFPRNLPTANTESMISLGEASPSQNSELLDNPGPSADSYPQLDHHIYDTAHSALIERDTYLNRLSHTNPTRFSLDFGIVQRGLSDSHIPQAAPRFTNPRTNLNSTNDQTLMVNNPNSRSSLASQSGTHNIPPAQVSAARDNSQRVLGTNRPSVRPTGMTIPARASTSSQTRMPLNLRLLRVLAENRGYNATSNASSIDPSAFGTRPPVTLNLAPDSHRSSTTYRSAPPIHSRPLNNEGTPNHASNASVNNPSGRSMDRRIRVVRQPSVVVQRVLNMPSEVQSSTSGASSVEDIQAPTVVTPDIRSILNNPGSQEQQHPSPESSDRSRTPEYSDSSLVEAVDDSHDSDWRVSHDILED
ncbi:hypothetical protein CLF_104241 [Clonorchis sinensis]|uniref:Uncharacterized protein n=1 Tax=Clonorchis sinensis TaxID=79923 RepID=G7YB78_CLOSI|nr:hypothetical protein CLF_104241 [Clonorchis sinensis]